MKPNFLEWLSCKELRSTEEERLISEISASIWAEIDAEIDAEVLSETEKMTFLLDRAIKASKQFG